jgi:hypothetical protein
MFIAPLRKNGRGADHRKYLSSVAIPLLLRERVYRAVAEKRFW